MTTTNEALVKAQKSVERNEKGLVKLIDQIKNEIGVEFDPDTLTVNRIRNFRDKSWEALTSEQKNLLDNLEYRLEDLQKSKEKLKECEHIIRKKEIKEILENGLICE